MRVLLGCVNSAVSLVGYDVERRQAFWYCPGNVLRVCGICRHDGALYVASDSMLQRLDADGLSAVRLPGPHENLAHSVKPLGPSLLGIADTGNSRILLHSGGPAGLALSPLEGWGEALPPDAIHLNDFVPWRDGMLASAFNHQPFDRWKRSSLAWKKEGWGLIYYMRRHQGHTVTRIVASGLNCPHSLCVHEGDVYCCSSAGGEFFRFREDAHGLLHEVQRWTITRSHFLRGCLRLPDGWLLGGSSQRHQSEGGGLMLYRLGDDGRLTEHPLGGPGEIYDIIPWDDALMPGICDALLRLPQLELEGDFPPRCRLPRDWGGSA